MKISKKQVPGGPVSANVSTLKTHLGRYLKMVKDGAEVTVLDRQKPVAKLVAYQAEAREEDVVLKLTAPTLRLEDVMRRMDENDKRRKPTKLKRPSLYYLMQDRGSW